MSGGWFGATVDVTVGDLTPPDHCCFCDHDRPAWVWSCTPFTFLLPSWLDPGGQSLMQSGAWTSSTWLACTPCHRLEHRGRHGQLVGRAIGGRLADDPGIGEFLHLLPDFLTGFFASARAAFTGGPGLLR